MPRKRKQTNIYRQWVVDNLRPHLPAEWDLRERGSRLDNISSVTVVVQLESINRLAQAPLRVHIVGFTVCIVVPDDDPDDAIDSVEAGVVALLHALDQTKGNDGQPILRWTGANRTTFQDRYRSMDVAVEVLTNTTPTTNTTTKE